MKQKYDVVCIGDVVMDAFIGLEKKRRKRGMGQDA